MAETFGLVFAPPSSSPISAGRVSAVFAPSPSPTSAGREAGLNYPHAPASTPSPASLWIAAAVDHQQAPAPTLSPPPLPAKGGVLAAIVATIATTILISFLVFYMLRRCLARRGNSRDSRPTVFPERKRQEGAPKGAILDDSGLDLLYWKKIHGIHQIKMGKASHRERLRSDGSLSSSSQAYADEKTEFEMLPVPDSVGKPPAVMPESTANSAWRPPRVSNAGTPQRQTVPVLNVNPSPSRYPNSTASARTPITTWPDSELDPRGGINANTSQPPNLAEHPPRPQQSMMHVNSAQKTQTVLHSSQSSPSYSTIPLPSQSLARPPLPPHPMMYAGPAQIKPQNDASSTPQSPPPSSSSSIAARPPPPSSQLESRPPLPPPPMMYVNSAPKSQKDVNSTPTSAPHLIERPVPTSAPMPLPPPSPLPRSEARPPPPSPPPPTPTPPPVTAASQDSQPSTWPPSTTKKPNTESQTPPVTGKAPPPPPVPGKAPPPPGKAPPPPRIGPLAKAPTAAKAKEKQNAQESSPEPMPKLKPLHWDKVAIPANSDHSMVWRRLREGSFSFDSDQMEALFGLGDPNTKSPAPSKTVPLANRSTNQVFLLDPRRSQNTAIVLRSIALPRETIVDSLLHGRDLAADVLEKLARIAPTLDDISAIRACPSDSVAQLADAESFLYDLLKAVPTAFRRVDAMLFRSSYDSEIHIFNENLQILGLACNELKSCTLFFRLLEVILKAGNQMNAGTERGNAQAFNLRTLSKLADVKSTDGKTTLLYFVVQEVVRAEGKKRAITREQSTRQPGSSRDQTMPRKEEIDQEYLTLGLPVVSGLSTELTNVKKAAGVEYEFVASCCNKLGVKVGEIKKFVSNLSGDEFKEEMDVFVAGAEKELQVLREDQNRVTDLVKKTIQYYHAGTGKDRPENLLQLFVIVKDFLNMVDQVCVEISKSLQRKKTHAGSAGPSTAVATAVRSSPRFANLPVHFVTENSRGSSDSDEEF